MLRVMSFNIRGFSRRGDGINSWENRAALNVATIKRYAPDLIGLQLLQAVSLDTYRETLPEYAGVLGPGAGNKAPHEFNAIFFDPTRLELLDSGGFWLSETPEVFLGMASEGSALRELGDLQEPERRPLLPKPEHAPRPPEWSRPREGE